MKKSAFKRKQGYKAPVIEGLEPRILLSADLPGLDVLAHASISETDDVISNILRDAETEVARINAEPSQRENGSISHSVVENEERLTITPNEEINIRSELVFINSNVPDYERLLIDLQLETDAARNINVLVIDSHSNGITQITQALSNYTDVDAIHILSHGDDGAIDLGNTQLTNNTLPEHQVHIQQWGQSLKTQADILIYGCNLVSSGNGQALIDQLAELTHADLAASDDITGHAKLGGNWELEAKVGDIETKALVLEEWEGLLAASNSVPSNLSTGIGLNNDGGNDAFLTDSISGLGYLDDNPGFAAEFQFSGLQSANTSATLYSNSDPGNSFSWLAINADGTLDWTGFTTNDNFTQLFDGGMHSVAVTWEINSGAIHFYVDGNFAESVTGPSNTATIGGGKLVIGQYLDHASQTYNSDKHFSGSLHDIRFWDNVRSAEEIGLNYQHKVDLTPAEAAAVGLVANWQMDGFNGSNEIVDIVNGNNLTVGHATGIGFVASTPIENLNVNENSSNDTHVGYVVPSDPDLINDIVNDGLFLEHSMAGTFEQISSGSSIGQWMVTQNTAVIYNDPASYGESPLDGRPLELGMSTGPATIEQALTTEVGKQYQIILSISGDWVGGDALKQLRVSAAGQSIDFSVSQPDGWSPVNKGWDYRSFSFTATSTSTTISLESLVTNVPQYNVVIGDVQVLEISPAVATILANDSSLTYDAATGKFYRDVRTWLTWNDAQTAAVASELGGESGQLVTIGSAYENTLVQNMSTTSYGTWLGGSDKAVEGDFYWYKGTTESEFFWQGTDIGSAQDNSYTNFAINQPQGETSDYLYQLKSSGEWDDADALVTNTYIIEWDASQVLSNYSFSLIDDANGRFSINTSTGGVTVADGSQLDYEINTSHNITVEVADTTGNTYSEVMSIAVANLGGEPTQTLPPAQSTIQDTTLVFSTANSNAISVSDTDAGTNIRLQVFISTNTNGTLTLSQTTGLSILGGSNGGTFMTIQGSESDLNAALEGMMFTPTGSFTGPVTLDMTTSLGADLTGYYTFNAGNAIDDSVGLSQNGTLTNNATTVTNGTRGEVLSLDGDRDYVQISSMFGNPANVTLAAWVNYSSFDTNGGEVITLGGDIALRVDDSSKGVTGFFYDGSSYQFIGSNISLADGNWHHIAFSFDDVSNTQILYIDGAVVGSATLTSSINYTGWFGESRIGAHPNDADANFDFNGLIDDARIYTRSLSADEVFNLATENTEVSNNVAITVTPANSAPVLPAAGGMFLTSITEDDLTNNGNLVSEIIDSVGGNAITDADAGALEGIAITSLNSSNGTWQYNIGGGWLDVGSASFIESLLLRDTDRLRFVPDGLHADMAFVTFSAWDQTTGTTGTKVNTSIYDATGAYSFALETAFISVSAVNDAPIADLNGSNGAGTNYSAAFSEGGLAVNITDTDATITDVEDATYQGLGINLSGFPDGILEKIFINASEFIYSVSKVTVTTVGATDFEVDFDGTGFTIIKNTSGDMPEADLQTLLRTITYQNISENPTIGDRTFNIIPQDANGLNATAAVSTITVSTVNNEPIVTTSVGITTYSEQAAAVIIDSSVTLVDPDGFDGADPSDQYVGVVQITGNYQASDILSFSNTANIEGNFIGNLLSLTVVSGQTASVIEFETALQSVTFYNASNTPSELNRTITFSFDDGVDSSNLSTKILQVTAVNDAPILTNGSTGGSSLEGNAQAPFSASTLTDADSANFDGGIMTFSITSGSDNKETLFLSPLGGVSTTGNDVYVSGVLVGTKAGGTNGSSLLITFNADATPAKTQSVYKALAIGAINGEDNPTTGLRNLTVTVTDGDGDISNTAIANVTITAVNDQSVADLNGSSNAGNNFSTTFNEGDSPVNLFDTGATISDADNNSYLSLNITLSGFSDGSVEEIILAGNQFQYGSAETIALAVGATNFNVDFDGSSFTLSNDIGGTMPEADLQSLLRGIMYEHKGGNPTVDDRIFSITPQDADGLNGITTTSTVSVGSTNTAPIISSNSGANTFEEGSVVITQAMLEVSDVDNSPSQITYTITADTTHGTLYRNATALSTSSTFTQADINAGIISYQDTDINTTADNFSFTVSDGVGGNISTTQFDITVNNINDAPQGTNNTVTMAEDTDYTFTASDFGFTDASDSPANNLLNVIITTAPTVGTLYVDVNGDGLVDGGETVVDVESVAIADITADKLKFKPTTDANGSSYDSFTFQVQDDGGTANSGVNTDQSFNTINIDVTAINDPATISGDITGSGNEGTVINGDLNATDADGLTDLTYFTISSQGSNGTALIDTETGAWGYTPTDANWFGADSFEVTVTDDEGGISTQTVSITVSNVNDPATISGDITGSGNEGSVINGDLNATDADGLTDLTYFTISSQGSNGTALIDTETGAWGYTPTDANWFGADSFEVTVTDDEGGISTQTVSITVSNVNNSAIIGGEQTGTITKIQDLPLLLNTSGALTITDVDKGQSNFRPANIAGNYGTISIDTLGLWHYSADNSQQAIQALGFSQTLLDSFTIISADGTTHNVVITIMGADNTPTIITPVTPELEQPTTPSLESADEKDASEIKETTDAKETINVIETETTTESVTETDVSLIPEFIPATLVPVTPNELFLSVLSERPSTIKTTDDVKPSIEATQTFLQELASFWKDDGIVTVAPSDSNINSPEFIDDVDKMLEDLNQSEKSEKRELELSAEAITGVSVTLTAGFVSWALRTGSLMASLLTAMPAWRHLDPMPILAANEKHQKKSFPTANDLDSIQDEEAEKQVDELFDR